MFSYQGSLQVLVSGFGLMVPVIWIRPRSWCYRAASGECEADLDPGITSSAGVSGNGIIWDIYQCSNSQNCSHYPDPEP